MASTTPTTQDALPASAVDTTTKQAAPAAGGLVLAETTAYRTTGSTFMSHTSGYVEQALLTIRLAPGGGFTMAVSVPGQAAPEVYILDSQDFELRPAGIDEITCTVHTLRAAGETNAQVLMAGELEGEDLPLYDFELRYKGGFAYSLFHPAAAPAHKLEPGQHKLVRLGFEQQREAQEFYSLLALCLGKIRPDHPSLDSLPKARAASKKLTEARSGSA